MTTPSSVHVSHAAGVQADHGRMATLARTVHGATHQLNRLQVVLALAARLFVGQVFFLAGLTKLRDWSSTLDLFAYEYQVPLLPPPVAAVLGTGAELVLPVLLVLGLGGRLAALGLFAVNVVAVLSLPDMPEAAFQLHVFWGSLLAGLVAWGPGCWSVDRWLERRFAA